MSELRTNNHSCAERYKLSSTLSKPDKEEGAAVYVFHFGIMETGAIVTIRAVFGDSQSGADMAITHMTTLPYEICGQGYGSEALQILLREVRKKKLENIQAVQVQRRSESFWVKNGFYRLGNATNDYRLGSYEKTPA